MWQLGYKRSLITIVCLVFAFGYSVASDVEIETVINQCCNEGNEWGTQRKHCSEYKFNLDKNVVPAGLHALCLSTVEICCAKQHRIYQCTAGSVAAKSSSSCDNNQDNYGTEFFKDCCEACKIGLVIGSTSPQCSTDAFSFGSPWDDIIEDCCSDIRDGDSEPESTENETNICQQIDDLCTQVCVPTDKSYTCKCHEGFELLEDNITCVKITNVEDNEIKLNDNETMVCTSGYTRDEITKKCEDTDECETGEANCNATTQACYNTLGSYKCLNILSTDDRQETACEEGFRYHPRIDQCTDINECSEETDNCNRKTQLCINTRGRYKCQNKIVDECQPGLKYNIGTKLCEDINECLLDPDSCDDGYKCVNTIGSFECIPGKKKTTIKPSTSLHQIPSKFQKKCAPGYQFIKDQCIDIDECSYDKEACDVNQVCTNEVGGYRCDCKIGFSLDALTNACEDVNECQINNHECLGTQRCDNTIGSYRCIRLQSCGTGYTFNAESGNCDDDDECVLNRHNCELPYECRNTKGSFRCIRVPTTTTTTTTTTTKRPTTVLPDYNAHQRTASQAYNPYPYNQAETRNDIQQQRCTPGFERNSLGACVDINECDTRSPCARNQKCININGGYRCQNSMSCSAGFILNPEGNQCVDVDECTTRDSICGPQQVCKNKPGGYACVCPAGFVSSNNRNCEDIDECVFYKDRKPCPSNADCINSIGSFRCQCKAGFKNNPVDERVCIDVDECQEYPGLCQHRCINFWGSYKCGCEPGYKLSENNRTCEDVDECEVHKDYKLCVGICENNPGSYDCTCPAGYRIGTDTRSCEDVDECTENPGVCRDRNDICTNIRGSHRCIPISCPYGYMRDPDRKHRCKKISMLCDRDDYECFRKPTSYSYNFISMVPNMTLSIHGIALFNLQTTSYTDNLEFDLKIEHIQAPQHVKKVDEDYFSLKKIQNGVNLYLTKSLDGPQDIELELSMVVYTSNHVPSGSSIAKIFLLVSEYPF